MRGTQSPPEISTLGGRIIPADAGNTKRRPSSTIRPWDHPRGCGEHRYKAAAVSIPMGSSPRMRGTLLEIPGSVIDDGIIPADAGNTRLQRS